MTDSKEVNTITSEIDIETKFHDYFCQLSKLHNHPSFFLLESNLLPIEVKQKVEGMFEDFLIKVIKRSDSKIQSQIESHFNNELDNSELGLIVKFIMENKYNKKLIDTEIIKLKKRLDELIAARKDKYKNNNGYNVYDNKLKQYNNLSLGYYQQFNAIKQELIKFENEKVIKEISYIFDRDDLSDFVYGINDDYFPYRDEDDQDDVDNTTIESYFKYLSEKHKNMKIEREKQCASHKIGFNRSFSSVIVTPAFLDNQLSDKEIADIQKNYNKSDSDDDNEDDEQISSKPKIILDHEDDEL